MFGRLIITDINNDPVEQGRRHHCFRGTQTVKIKMIVGEFLTIYFGGFGLRVMVCVIITVRARVRVIVQISMVLGSG